MTRLSRYQSTLKKWGLIENPFRPTPPDDRKKLAKIFYGRDQVLDIVIPTLYEGRNILVRGAWGIGKTALIFNLIHQLQQEVAELNEKMLVLYLSSIPGESSPEFYRALLLAVADSLADSDQESKDIANTLLGYSIQRNKTTTEGQVKLGFLSFGKKEESPANQLTPTANADPYPLLIRLLDRAEEIYSRIVIAIDDFDKKDPIVVQTILESS
jgi:Cdc6-like AAA superfamily ATPase